MRKKILFVGTYLSKSRGSISIAEKLKKEFEFHDKYCVILVSTFNFKIFRVIDITCKILFGRYSHTFIDTYSGTSFKLSQWAAFFLRLKKKPYTLIVRGGNFVNFFETNSARVEKEMRKANDLLCPSKYLTAFFASRKLKVGYLPNYIDAAKFPFRGNSHRKLHSLLWVRAFGEIYNPDIPIKVLAKLKLNYRGAKLTMIGPDLGLLSSVSEEIKRLGLNEDVTITGPLPNSELYKFYQTHSVYLNTTSFESFGMALLEAASCGIPIVSTNVGEIPFIYDNNKNIFLVDNFSIEEFVEKISTLFDSSTLQTEFGLNGQLLTNTFNFNAIKLTWEDQFSKFDRAISINNKIKSLLFVGTFLSRNKGSLGASETLMSNLRKDGLNCYLSSRYQNKMFRLMDIMLELIFGKWKIIHVDVFSGSNFYIARVSTCIARILNKRVMLTLHGGMLPEFFKDHPKMCTRIFNKSDSLATPSTYLKTFFESKGFLVNYMPNSIDLSKFSYNEIRPAGNVQILWVRAFGEIYQPMMAVDVLHHVKNKYPLATLTMVGPDLGLLNATKRYIKKLGVEESVNLTGFIDNSVLENYYHSHTIYINTTKYESFGISVLEAASCGIPIVSNNVGEIPNLWKHSVDILISELNNPHDMAYHVIKLFEDMELRKLLAWNAKQKSENFSWDRLKDQWFTNLEALC